MGLGALGELLIIGPVSLSPSPLASYTRFRGDVDVAALDRKP